MSTANIICASWKLKMIDFIYHTVDLDDQICQWIDELCREWGSSCFISRSDKTRLWVRRDYGERIRVRNFGSNLPEFREQVKRVAK